MARPRCKSCRAYLGAHSLAGEYDTCSPCRGAAWKPDDGPDFSFKVGRERVRETQQQREDLISGADSPDACECGGFAIPDEDGNGACLLCNRVAVLV